METTKSRKEKLKGRKTDVAENELERSNNTMAAFLGNKQRKPWMAGNYASSAKQPLNSLKQKSKPNATGHQPDALKSNDTHHEDLEETPGADKTSDNLQMSVAVQAAPEHSTTIHCDDATTHKAGPLPDRRSMDRPNDYSVAPEPSANQLPSPSPSEGRGQAYVGPVPSRKPSPQPENSATTNSTSEDIRQFGLKGMEIVSVVHQPLSEPPDGPISSRKSSSQPEDGATTEFSSRDIRQSDPKGVVTAHVVQQLPIMSTGQSPTHLRVDSKTQDHLPLSEQDVFATVINQGSTTPRTSILAPNLVHSQARSTFDQAMAQVQSAGTQAAKSWSYLSAALWLFNRGAPSFFLEAMKILAAKATARYRTVCKLSGRGHECPRLELLQQACNQLDYTYLLLHQLFCWSHITIPRGEEEARNLHKTSFLILNRPLAPNESLTGDALAWFAQFPGPLDLPALQATTFNSAPTLRTIASETVSAMSQNWDALQQRCISRKYPPLVTELFQDLKVRSETLQQVIFRAMLRQLSGDSNQALTAYEAIFYRNQEHHANVINRVSTTTLGENLFVKEYLGLASRRASTAPGETRSTEAQKADFQPVSNPSFGVSERQTHEPQHNITQVRQSQEPRNLHWPGGQTPNQFNNLHWPGTPFVASLHPLNGSDALSRTTISRPITTPASVGSGSPNLTSNSQNYPQSIAYPVRPATSMSPVAVPRRPSISGPITPQFAPHPPISNAGRRIAAPAFNRTPSSPSLNTHTNSGPHQRFIDTPAHHFTSPQPLTTPYPSPTQPYPHFRLEPSNTAPANPTSAGPSHWPHDQFLFGNQNPAPPGPFNSNIRPRPASLSLPNNGISAAGSGTKASPPLSRGPLEQCFSYIKYVATLPETMNPRMQYQHHRIVLCQEDVRAVAKDPPIQCYGGPPTYLNMPGAITYRVRCIKTQSRNAVTEQEWVTSDHVWPSHVTISLNGHALLLHRKSQQDKDYPVDVTCLVVEGPNNFTVAVMSLSETRNEHYAFGLETIETISYSQVKGSIRYVDFETARRRILSKLINSDPDVEIMDPQVTLDLTDPFSAVMYKIAARGKDCVHHQCFDLDTFLTTRTSGSKNKVESCGPDEFRCPICKGDVRPKTIVIDGFFQDIRSKLDGSGRLDVKAVVLRADGEWQIKEEEEGIGAEEGHGRRKRKSSSVELPGQPNIRRSVTAPAERKASTTAMIIELD
ncbi:uncharacterized protein KY384_001447 [Bacidia gigantensis]|uniref:uncharacterized protein n=1 Tax=Bacidia gigantensis TaxID=2732470 RepID=UPI001D0401A9|nr:uncharacterized protein KY384_001447 [Bacidia gigantensis]KAG8533706.1 hypothetical protein KY384_001447 [Bacidia gigantensis]